MKLKNSTEKFPGPLNMQFFIYSSISKDLSFSGNSAGKESFWNSGDPSSIPGSGRSPGGKDRLLTPVFLGFPGSSDGKGSICNAEDLALIPGLGRSPGGGHGNPLQCSCLENPMDRRA